MTQLTGPITGTTGNDSFIGDFDLDVVASTTGAGIVDAAITTLEGDDRVEGQGVLLPSVGELSVTGIGIGDSVIKTGDGGDTVLANGYGARFFETFGFRGPEFSGSGTSYGLFSSVVDSGAGDDVLIFSTDPGNPGFPTETGDSFGVFKSFVSAGSGADEITISGKEGAVESRIFGGRQQDLIEVNANGVQGAGTGIDRSVISGDRDNDNISIRATGVGEAIASKSSRVVGGSGNDEIVLNASARLAAVRDGFFGTTTAVAADETTRIQASRGNDVISLSAIADSSSAFAYGARNARVEGGNGADTITLSAENGGFGGQAFGAFNSVISGGAGNDMLTLIGKSVTADGQLAGASDSTIRGDRGDDIIRFVGQSGIANVRDSAGVIDSTVSGGSGNDLIEVQLETVDNGVGTLPSYGIIDGILDGGSGDDTFDVGIGTGRLSGGEGNDTALVSYLDTETMSAEAISGGVRISGTETNNGEAGAWSQDILGVESFQVGDIAYTATDFVSVFG